MLFRSPLNAAPPPAGDDDDQQNDDNQQPQQADGTQRITDPQQLLEFFKSADNAAADAMLAQWRAEKLDNDNRQQDNDVQRFFNYIGWTADEPEVLDEASYQAAWQAAGQPTTFYHTDKPYGGVGARQFAAQFMGQGTDAAGNKYRHFLSGGIHGAGTYLAPSASNSAMYGTSQFRGFLNSNAKVISEANLDAKYQSFTKKYPALKHVINQMSTAYGNGYDEARSVFAAMLGYNTIDASYHSGYHAVLNRKAMTVSSQTKRASYGMPNW